MTPVLPFRRPDSPERGWLTNHGVRPKRRLGQNFLLDSRISRELVRRAAWPAGTPVVEIGAGGGALTAELLAAGFPVTAVEIDVALIAVLHARFSAEIGAERLRVVEGDFLELSLESLADSRVEPSNPADSLAPSQAGGSTPRRTGASARRREGEIAPSSPAESAPEAAGIAPPRRPWIAGNLPYGVTTPVLLHVLAAADRLDGAVFMVQREYGKRLLARPGEEADSSISVRTAAQARTRQLLLVGRSAFWPRPGVESLVVELTFPRPAPYSGSIPALERVLRAGFGQRRKTLENALAHGLGRTKDEAHSLLQRADCDPGARAETLSLAQFGALATLVGDVPDAERRAD